MFTIITNKKTCEKAGHVNTAKDVDGTWLTQSEGGKQAHRVKYHKNQNRFVCDCHAFAYGKGIACKHIISVIGKYVKNAKIELQEE